MIAVAAQQAFYDTAAQVIPLLLLVLLIGEGRVIRTDHQELSEWRSTVLLAISVTGILVLGELAALRTLGRGHDSPFLHAATVLALVYGFTFVFAQAAKLILLGRAEDMSAERKEALGRFYMLTVLIALLASLGILYPELELLAPGF